MPKFSFSTFPLQAEFSMGQWFKQTILRIGGASENRGREVEADNMKTLQPLFDAFVADMTATGEPLHCFCTMRGRDRAPRGFNAARETGGSLSVDVNWEIAQQRFHDKQAAKAAA
jgi:hypothetical protein